MNKLPKGMRVITPSEDYSLTITIERPKVIRKTSYKSKCNNNKFTK